MSQLGNKLTTFKQLVTQEKLEEIKYLQQNNIFGAQQENDELSWLKPGEKCWLKNEKEANYFEKAEVRAIIDKAANKVVVRNLRTGSDLNIEARPDTMFMRTDDIDEATQKTKEDMVDLECLNEPELLNNVKTRYNLQQIYTYVGPTLIVCNPFEVIADLYSEETLEQYYKKIIRDGKHMGGKAIAPHIFAVAAQNYIDIDTNTDDRNQAIVISGESGSGKTETTKHAMKFLTSVDKMTPDAQERLIGIKNENLEKSKTVYKNLVTNVSSVEDRILSCNPILEAFGNAKTTRNNNSSRFGKLITLILKKRSRCIIGAEIDNYLLEKARVTSQGAKERNFHIFYHFLLGASKETLLKYQIDDVSQASDLSRYEYLNQSGCFTHEAIDDPELYQSVVTSFELLKFNDYADAIWRLIAAILFIGNIAWDDSTYDFGRKQGESE